MNERKPFLLRLPQDLHDDLRAWADQELRSLNGQIEYLLREAVRQRRGGTGAEAAGGASGARGATPSPRPSPRSGRRG